MTVGAHAEVIKGAQGGAHGSTSGDEDGGTVAGASGRVIADVIGASDLRRYDSSLVDTRLSGCKEGRVERGGAGRLRCLPATGSVARNRFNCRSKAIGERACF